MKDIKNIINKREELIKSLAILKVKKYLSIIDEKEFTEEIVDIYSNEYYCGAIENLSHISFNEVVKRIEEIKESNMELKVLFNEKVMIKLRGYFTTKVCDVILLTKNSIEVIKIISREEDIINIYESSEMKIIGLGVIDKFLSQTSSELINLTIIQPNILVLSIFQVGIEDLLHQCEYTIM